MSDIHSTGPFIAAIDQGTTSSRCIVFDKDGRIVSVDQKEHEQILPKPGWVEHDATEIWQNVQQVVTGALDKAGITKQDVLALGITNQRETTLLWDKNTGEPVHNAIVWTGHPHGRALPGARPQRRSGPLPAGDGTAARLVLRGAEDPLAARQRRGAAGARRAG